MLVRCCCPSKRTMQLREVPLLTASALCKTAEHQYAALQDVVFSLNASQEQGTLYTNSTTTDSATSCNQRCLTASASGLLQENGQPLNCTMWRYCSSLTGCNGSMTDTSRALRSSECQLQSFYVLDESFSEEPYLRLGGKGRNVTDNDTLYGVPTLPSCSTL